MVAVKAAKVSAQEGKFSMLISNHRYLEVHDIFYQVGHSLILSIKYITMPSAHDAQCLISCRPHRDAHWMLGQIGNVPCQVKVLGAIEADDMFDVALLYPCASDGPMPPPSLMP